ncbi:MAG TPA: alpha-glucuronidase family glycosyl hydrolase [Tepidisphaeraceae bacterium]|jgi:alpha-glucuronidase
MTGEDGSQLWLSFPTLENFPQRWQEQFASLRIAGSSATMRVVQAELKDGLGRLLGSEIALRDDAGLIVGTPSQSQQIASLKWESELAAQGSEGYLIRWANLEGRQRLIIASQGETGLLYGVFDLLRHLQMGMPLDSLDIAERPRLGLRMLNHWDNLDGSIERGYAGRSLWKWEELPGKIDPRYAAYARACASIGINATALNNVNADPRILEKNYLRKVAVLADIFRPYGLRVFLSANFAAPIMVGGLKTADPLDQKVADWWKHKAAEIYELVPDFGGWLVKANSEGQPGPQDYHRTHADGANVLADALQDHGGIVIWRAFVYDEKVDPDRIKRAYKEFKPLDGKFRDNVMVQVKNGPLDFMPREPFHPLFGAMRKTPVMAEVQAAQEYTGQAKHLVFLGTMWKEFLDSDTCAEGEGSTVGKVLEENKNGGTEVPVPVELTGMAAVANTGDGVNWCGHDFSQANWYAFGRLAWNPDLPAEHITEEWIGQTFTCDSGVLQTIKQMMLSSREIYVNYTMPLGLHHLIGGDHYAPMPWNDSEPRADWTATYYHRASADGIGVDRTAHGDRATGQYFPAVAEVFDDVEKCPENLILWFHRLSWDHVMRSGRALHEELRARYFQGAEAAAGLEKTWQTLKGKIDPGRHAAVAKRLAIQTADSALWRDRCVAYFQNIYLRAGRAAIGGALRIN